LFACFSSFLSGLVVCRFRFFFLVGFWWVGGALSGVVPVGVAGACGGGLWGGGRVVVRVRVVLVGAHGLEVGCGWEGGPFLSWVRCGAGRAGVWLVAASYMIQGVAGSGESCHVWSLGFRVGGAIGVVGSAGISALVLWWGYAGLACRLTQGVGDSATTRVRGFGDVDAGDAFSCDVGGCILGV